MSRLTSLARHTDPRIPSNRAALIVSGASGIVAWLMEISVAAPVIGSFLAWAISRELDPDHPRSATLAAIGTGIVAVLTEGPSLVVALIALLTVRVLMQPTGKPPTVLDLLGLIALAFFGAQTATGWAAGLALAFAIARDHRLPNPGGRHQLFASAAIAAAATAGAVAAQVPGTWTSPTLSQWMLLAAGLLAALSLIHYEPLTIADNTAFPLYVERLRSARRGGLGVGAFAFVVAGSSGITDLSPLWLAFVAIGIHARLANG